MGGREEEVANFLGASTKCMPPEGMQDFLLGGFVFLDFQRDQDSERYHDLRAAIKNSSPSFWDDEVMGSRDSCWLYSFTPLRCLPTFLNPLK